MLCCAALWCHYTEQTKYLGGDLAHTHLVKGLDYQLLERERQKLKAAAAAAGGGSEGSTTAAASAAAPQAKAAAQQQPVKFVSPLGRSLYNAVFRPQSVSRAQVREMFQPRRTAFVFEFEEGCGDVPTTLRRSKADCPPVQVRGTGQTSAPKLPCCNSAAAIVRAFFGTWAHNREVIRIGACQQCDICC
jgi:IK cytokine